MIIKRYIVKTMNEAMTRIRYELGKDAVIISQRKIRKPGIKGLFTSKLIEVTAAVENQIDDKEQNVVNSNILNNNNNKLSSMELSSIEAIKKVVQQENAIKDDSRQSQKQNSVVHKISNQVEEKNDNSSDKLFR